MPSERSGEVSPGGHASHSPRSARLYRPAVQTEQPVLNHWLSFPLSARLSLALLEECKPDAAIIVRLTQGTQCSSSPCDY